MPDSKIIPFVGSNAGIPKGSSAGGPVRSDMRSDLVEKASAVVPDPPVLINMVSRRVRQLNNGRPPLVRRPERLGQADVALLEIIEGKIVLAADGTVVERPAAPAEKVKEPAAEVEQS
jgi:DNA-directed RNA polymerase subunit omega